MGLIAAVLLVATAPSRDPEFEKKVFAQYEAVEPGLGRVFERATRSLDGDRLDDAAIDFVQLTGRAPGVATAFRRLASVRVMQKQFDEAVALAEKAFELEPGPDAKLTLAFVLAQRKGTDARGRPDLARARDYLQQAVAGYPQGSRDWASAKALSCSMEFERNEYELGAKCAEALLEVDSSAQSQWLGFVGAAHRGDFSLARERLEKARDALPPDKYQELAARLDQAEPWTSRYGPLAGWATVGWLALLGAMALVGLGLSALTLSSARTLAGQKDARATGGAVTLRSVYRAVMALGSVLFYVSLPFVALGVVGLFGGLAYLTLAVGHVPVKLLLIALFVGGASLFALVKSVFVRGDDSDPGLKLDWQRAPRLKAFIDEVAKQVGTRTVDTLFITPGTDLAVFERGSYLKKLKGEGERCLILGRGVLDAFERRGFRSVLAHEFGHFSHQDTAGGGMALVGRRSLMRMGQALAESGVATWYNPAWLFFRAYFAIYMRISQGASRLQEVLADRVAIFTFGSAAFAQGYRHVIERSVRFDFHVSRTIQEVVDNKLPLTNLYRFAPRGAEPSEDIAKAIEETIARPAGPFDSHPSSKERLEWAAALAVQVPAAAEDQEQVLSLFDDLEALERQITDEVRANVAVNHQLAIPGA